MHPTDPDSDNAPSDPFNRLCPAPTAGQTPYEGLTPHAVLDALDAVALRGDGRILQLNSYENRVFQVGLEDGRFVVAKFYRAGRWSDAQILEEHAFALELAGEDVPVVAPLTLAITEADDEPPCAPHPADPADPAPPVRLVGTPATLAHVGPWRFGVTPRCAGRDPELEDPAALRWVGRFLARLHVVGQRRRYEHRASMPAVRQARESAAWLADQDILPPQSAAAWQRAADAALDQAAQLFARTGEVATLRLHGDMHRGNLLWRPPGDTEPGGPHFVDLDDTCMGPAVHDLWMLLSGDRADASAQLRELLAGYESIRAFDRRELGLIEALRTVRLIQHSAWIARRWSDPAFPAAFVGFDSPAWWSQQTTQLLEQMAAMAGEPLAA